MSATLRSSIYPCTLAGASTVTLRQIHGVSWSSGANKDVIVPGGAIDPSSIPMIFADPRVTLMTYDLATLIAGVSITAGLPITGSSLIQFQNRTDNGTFEGSSAHTQLSLTKGWAGITSISASQDGPAEASIVVFPEYDGTNAPLVPATLQSLTSSPTFTSKFSLGPLYVNGTEVPGVISTTVSPGIDFRTTRESGDVYARRGAIYMRQPSISVQVVDMSDVGTVASMFNASLAGTVAQYFRKLAGGGSRVADATTAHCKLSAAAGVWNPGEGNVSQNDDGTVTLTIQVTGTMSSSVASAIP